MQNVCRDINREVYKNTESNEKKMCGLWHAHVCISEYNDFGKCNCIDCFGMHCQDCKTYFKLRSKIDDVIEKTICDKCLGR